MVCSFSFAFLTRRIFSFLFFGGASWDCFSEGHALRKRRAAFTIRLP